MTAAKQGAPDVKGWVLDSVTLACRLVLGVVFLYACWFKIVDPEDFAINIATYQILPDSLINVLALTLPWLELATGVLLIAGALSRESAVTITGMLVMFIVAILIAMSKDLKISCGCFASEDAAADIGWPKVIEDVAMLAAAVWVVIRGGGRLSVDGLVQRLRSRKDGARGDN
jgi:uncharacterized membrane protein YphA (DoxX/SURF4 family)